MLSEKISDLIYSGECGVYLDPPPRLDPRNAGLGEQCHLLQFDQLPRWSTQPLPKFSYEEHIPSKSGKKVI